LYGYARCSGKLSRHVVCSVDELIETGTKVRSKATAVDVV
jgi:hypothetical protein